MFKLNKESGQVARLLLVLAVVVLVAVIIVYLVMKMAEKPAKPIVIDTTVKIPLPVYEKTLGDIRFVFESAIDRGNTLTVSEMTSKQYTDKDLTTAAKFIQVTIGAQNKGKANTESGAWDIGNIVDSEGRNFVPLDDYNVSPWLPLNNSCKVLLKPEFDPVPCTKIYEVSKASTGLKINIITGENNNANNLSSGKTQEFLLDLIVK